MQTLLLLEDDESFASIFERYFTAGGYDVVKTAEVEEALSRWVKDTPDLVVASSRVMRETGPRVRGALLRQTRRGGVPVIASGVPGDDESLPGPGWASETFYRPIHPERIWDIVRRYLGHVEPPQVQIDLQRFAVPPAARPRPIDWSDEILEDIVYLIYETTGNFLKKRERLTNMVERRMRELRVARLFEYDRLLRKDPKELSNLVDLVTVNETFFFRSSDHFDALREHILPGFAREKNRRELSIWSSACSTGPEPYSVAMLCAEVLPGWKVEIAASDIDHKAIQTARKGLYTSHMIDRTPPEYRPMLLRHVSKNGDDRWAVDPALRDGVTFLQENILEATYAALDLAFCRNVMIYFDRPVIERMVANLCRSLRRGGILIVGESEYLACEVAELERVRCGRASVYRKRKAEART